MTETALSRLHRALHRDYRQHWPDRDTGWQLAAQTERPPRGGLSEIRSGVL